MDPVAVPSPEEQATRLLESLELRRCIRNDLVKLGFSADPDIGETLYLCKISALLSAPVYVYLVRRSPAAHHTAISVSYQWMAAFALRSPANTR